MESPAPVAGLDRRLQRRLKLAGTLVSGGLIVEVLTMAWFHPLSFFVFAGVGAALVGAGTLIYLFALVSPR